MSTFVTHTPLAQLRPIGSEGERSFARVGALVERHLSARHAAILADPVPVRNGSGIDWYTDADGEIVSLSALADAEAGAVKEALQAILADIRAAADRLEAEGAKGRQHTAAAALRNAALFPGEESVFVVRDGDEMRPIVVAWGYEGHDPLSAHAFNVSAVGPDRQAAIAPAATEPLVAMSGRMAAEPLPVTPIADGAPGARPSPVVPERSGGRFGWAWLMPAVPAALSLLLMLAIAGLLLPACGLRTPFGTVSFGFPASYGCGSIVSAAVLPALAEGNSLQRELAVVQQEYQRQRLACLIPQTPVQPPASPQIDQVAAPPAADEDFAERVDQRGEAQITLIWEGQDDLDLFVNCPDGQTISYQNGQACGGTLDIDQNTNNNIRPNPVENITFPGGLTEHGDHVIGVKLYTSRTAQFPVPFRLRVRDGSGTRMLQGEVARQGDIVIVDKIVN